MNISKKLTSRKFWLALAGFVIGVLALLGIDNNTTQQVSGVVMSLGSIVAYIAGEGYVDATATNAANPPTDGIAQ